MAGDTIVTIVGNLTADPELRYTPSGSPVANFTVASTPRTFDRASGQWKDGDALFMRCSVWREFAENVADSLSKGMRVVVQGRLIQRSYEGRDGSQRTSVELQVDEIGPSLRYARAQVTRTPSNFGGAQGTQGGFNQGSPSGFNQGGFNQPEADSFATPAPYGNAGGYGTPAGAPSFSAAPGGSAADPWSTGGGSSFDDEPPF
ncbi:single-strand binding family protein [Gleimia coleocanis DSM 15436]|uniref:Single-stranded DNA-binding protein n=1 Tax=Gleimia coleocanis DSM 15436 TaxID=525245 RepID=C0VXY0_9ACTO|nr:single-stranded DNA-binding protein [Gleimia coleocanis]EEH64283.1 single-strand binding family protein [Gleimia coleocanis DSM 15436]